MAFSFFGYWIRGACTTPHSLSMCGFVAGSNLHSASDRVRYERISLPGPIGSWVSNHFVGTGMSDRGPAGQGLSCPGLASYTMALRGVHHHLLSLISEFWTIGCFWDWVQELWLPRYGSRIDEGR